MNIKGIIKLDCYKKDGSLKWSTGEIDNLTPNAGIAQMALLLGDATAIPFTYLAVGTSSAAPAANQTALVAEITTNGLARATATFSRITTTITNDTAQYVKSWSVSGTSTVNEVGIFNASSGGTMGGRALTGIRSVINGETLVGTYKVIFSV